MNIDLSGKTAIVTGSTEGIGFAVAQGLARAGATVVVNGRTRQKVDAALAKLAGPSRGVAADSGMPEGCAALVASEPAPAPCWPTGARDDRPGLKACLDDLQPGDVLVVWKLDRLGRSLPHLLAVVTDLKKRGVAFRSLTEQMDTTTPHGALLFGIFGSLAQYERAHVRPGQRCRRSTDACLRHTPEPTLERSCYP